VIFSLGIFVAFIAYVAVGIFADRRHCHTMQSSFKYRIHVNGIRGKSSVTRLVAATLREDGVKTVAKTTGTAARIMVSHGNDWPVSRKEANISEQRRMLKLYTKSSYKAVVFECMAINPIYQKYLENKIMYSTIGIITNVREDHTDMLGKTLPEIAQNLASTVPHNGHLVTAETNTELLEILSKVCTERDTRLHVVDAGAVSDKNIAKFSHYEYKENVAIALKIAELVGIKKRTALAGMYKALPDPGAFILKKYKHQNKTVYWANLFAINDRQSFVQTVKSLSFTVNDKPKKAVILNNRHDRPERVAQFVDIAVNSIGADYVITFGDYEKQVLREVRRLGAEDKVKVVHCGNSTQYRDAKGAVLFDKIIESIDDPECIIFGAVNIHTPQSQALLSLIESGTLHHA
jgi:poly-gamma-glutamate synthase PgsB/CapB